MLELTAANVNTVWMDCLGNAKEPRTVEVDCIVHAALLDMDKIEEHDNDIADLLLQLPHEFRMSGGGGMSFLNACMTAKGDQWGEHPDMAHLFGLGLAAGFVQCQLPRGIWDKLPGGMPYYVILDKEDQMEVPGV